MLSNKVEPLKLELDQLQKLSSELVSKFDNHTIIFLSFPDSFIESCFLKDLYKINKFHYRHGEDVSGQWLMDEFSTPSLFSMGNKENYLVGKGDTLKREAIELLKNQTFENLENNLLIVFKNSDKIAGQILKARKDILEIKITLPKFWEGVKFIDYFSRSLEIKLSSSATNFVSNSLDFSSSDYYGQLEKIKLFSKDCSREITLQDCQAVITGAKLDQFQLSELFSLKKKGLVFERLIEARCSMEWFRTFCHFMQGHLYKILEPGYMAMKPKLSQYDKKIKRYSESWGREDLLFEMRRFAEWEILAKKKDPLLMGQIKQQALHCRRQ